MGKPPLYLKQCFNSYTIAPTVSLIIFYSLSQQLMHLDVWSLEVKKLAELLTLIPLVIPGMIIALFFKPHVIGFKILTIHSSALLLGMLYSRYLMLFGFYPRDFLLCRKTSLMLAVT